ncbi:MAG: DUF4345 family protein [Pseudomonadota bacterium]
MDITDPPGAARRLPFAPTVLQRAVLSISALLAAYIGWEGIVDTTGFLRAMDVEILGPGGMNEIRAQYGGFFGAVTIVCLLGMFGRIRPSAALTVMIAIYGGVLFGRLVSLGLDGMAVFESYPALLQRAHVIDLVGLILSAIALRQGDRAA